MGKRKNSTKAERTALLKKLGYTETDMQNFWNECKEINTKVKMLSNAGLNWTDLTVHQIEQLPTLKETTLKQIEEKVAQEAAEAERKVLEEEAEKYYEEHFEEIMLTKLEKGEHLTEDELRELVEEYEWEELEDGDRLRWTQVKHTIVKLGDKFFKIDWQQGLTENQPNEFMDQPYEVELHEYEKTITVREWKEK